MALEREDLRVFSSMALAELSDADCARVRVFLTSDAFAAFLKAQIKHAEKQRKHFAEEGTGECGQIANITCELWHQLQNEVRLTKIMENING